MPHSSFGHIPKLLIRELTGVLMTDSGGICTGKPGSSALYSASDSPD